MKVYRTLADWAAYRDSVEGSVGFVPTMGALHAGHGALIERSRALDRHTVVSLIVNPTQFDREDDFTAYPADVDGDLAQLERLGVQAALVPPAAHMYPDSYRYRISESHFSRELCGAHRPGHFDGVLTVVMRLLNLVRPHRAYFGEKDYQQLELVRGMVDAFFMRVSIVACPIVREPDGLAMSSRNRRLDEHQRRVAPRLYRTLRTSTSAGEARCRLTEEGFSVDYVEDHSMRRFAAAWLGDVRLIDNVPLEGEGDLPT